MKIKTSELTDAALDWAVATCMGWKYNDRKKIKTFLMQRQTTGKHCYSTVWAHGGPIIESELIDVASKFRCADVNGHWAATISEGDKCYWLDGPTPLIAAMRCFVASRLGDEVEIPEDVIK